MIYGFDIEVIPLPKEERLSSKPSHDTMKWGALKDPAKREAKLEDAITAWERGDKAGLDPVQGRVALIVIKDIDGKICEVLDSEDEKVILNGIFGVFGGFSDLVTNRIVGHNIINFDIQFIYKRAWLLGMRPDDRVMHDSISYRPSCVVDTMKRWAFGDRNSFISLKLLCSHFGIVAKGGEVEGKNFHEWWAKDKQKCIDYCIDDVNCSLAVAERMGLV